MSADRKALQKLEKLSLRDDFILDIRKIRKILKIPIKGYKSEIKFDNWHKERGLSIGRAIQFRDLIDFFLEYDLARPFRGLLESYILSNHSIRIDQYNYHNSCEVQAFEEKSDDKGYFFFPRKRYAVIVDEAASEEEVVDFINKNQAFIHKTILGSGIGMRVKRKRLRPLKDIDRDKLVLEYSGKSDEELGFNSKHDKFREIVVSRLIFKEKGISIDSDYIKTIVRRRKRG